MRYITRKYIDDIKSFFTGTKKIVVESAHSFFYPLTYSSPVVPHIKNFFRRVKNYISNKVWKLKVKFKSYKTKYKMHSWLVSNFQGLLLQHLLKNYDPVNTPMFKSLVDTLGSYTDSVKWLTKNFAALSLLNQSQTNLVIDDYINLVKKVGNAENIYLHKFVNPDEYYFLNSQVSLTGLEIMQAEVIQIFWSALNDDEALKENLNSIVSITYMDYLRLETLNEEILEAIKQGAQIRAQTLKLNYEKFDENNLPLESEWPDRREIMRQIARILKDINFPSLLQNETFLGTIDA